MAADSPPTSSDTRLPGVTSPSRLPGVTTPPSDPRVTSGGMPTSCSGGMPPDPRKISGGKPTSCAQESQAPDNRSRSFVSALSGAPSTGACKNNTTSCSAFSYAAPTAAPRKSEPPKARTSGPAQAPPKVPAKPFHNFTAAVSVERSQS